MKIQVTGEQDIDEIQVNGGTPSRIIDVTAGLVSSVNGQTGAITGLATTEQAQDAATDASAAAIAAHVAATDPHGDRNLIRPDNPLATDFGFTTWAYDPSPAGTNSVFTGGVIQLVRVPIRGSRSITNIVLYVGTAGATLTAGSCWAGIYDSSGNRLGQTVDQATAWTSTGTKTMAISGGPLTLTEGYYWVAFVATGTTIPAFLRASGVGGAAINVGLSAANTRFGTYGTAGTYTTLPATITPGSIGQANNAYWAALS